MGWEMIDKVARLERYPVYGGWLVRNTFMYEVLQKRDALDRGEKFPVNGVMALEFVPDPEHKWEIPKSPEEEKK